MAKCECTVCKGRDPNTDGIALADREVIPFFKEDLLKLRYPNHPLPMRFKGLLEVIYCYGQALAWNRAHSVRAVFYTDNKWMLRFSSELEQKFGMKTDSKDNLPEESFAVCEFNIPE